jgi:hypothetical protein
MVIEQLRDEKLRGQALERVTERLLRLTESST